MGKTYIDTVKYIVYANMEINGLVEKPDVVGAIFGQTEGLLGDELDLRELQKNGRIGRIEVDLEGRGNRSIGKIRLPSSLDMVETCILASALETVDRVGPCDARISVQKVEDTRSVKRKVLVDRAKKLLKNLLTEEIPESREISEQVRTEVKAAEICEYGPDKLSAGPGITKVDEIVLVEGRADVINLLKNDISNVIAVGGANVSRTIAKLCQEKEVTVFLDGDRGGDIILNGLSKLAEIDFVARAPAGKEVEELTRKEIIKCLRSKIPYEQNGGMHRDNGRYRHNERRYSKPRERQYDSHPRASRGAPAVFNPAPIATPKPEPKAEEQAQNTPREKPSEVPAKLIKELSQLENTLKARFYDESLKAIKEMPVRDMIKNLEASSGVYAIIFDGIITQRLADLAEKQKASILVGIKLGNVFRHPAGVLLHTKN